jgi:phage baseplate assembly protein W
MLKANLEEHLLNIYGLDLSFDPTPGIQEVRSDAESFLWVAGPTALAEEIQRLFNLTDKGSFVDDPSYGIDLRDLIGTAMDPRILINIVRLRVIEALEHPSFRSRCEVGEVRTWWESEASGAIMVEGSVRCYGFEDLDWLGFGPYALTYWRGGGSRV